jgi:hypothetical protein
MAKFGFTVEKLYNRDADVHWVVRLPHQCDSWEITDECSGAPHAEAVAETERFIAEATEALAALRAGKEYGND